MPLKPPLHGDVDLERLVRAVPAFGHTIKGVFVARNIAIVESEWPSIEPLLTAPPRGGKYLSFTDYPLVDYLRISDAAARKKYPSIATREAHRLLSRSTFDVFAETALGRVMVSMVSGPESVLTKYPEVYNRMVAGSRVEATVLEPRVVRVSFNRYYSFTEAIYGVLEGIVLAWGLEPSVTVEAKGETELVAEVTWELPQ